MQVWILTIARSEWTTASQNARTHQRLASTWADLLHQTAMVIIAALEESEAMGAEEAVVVVAATGASATAPPPPATAPRVGGNVTTIMVTADTTTTSPGTSGSSATVVAMSESTVATSADMSEAMSVVDPVAAMKDHALALPCATAIVIRRKFGCLLKRRLWSGVWEERSFK